MRYLLACFLLIASACAAAADVNQLIAKANAGDAAAQYQLGTMYSSGEGVERNPDEAFAWFQKAARQGYKDALYSLAVSYYNGSVFGGSVASNAEKAWIFFTLGAQQGDAASVKEADRVAGELSSEGIRLARYHLALLQLYGGEAPQDVPRALRLLETLAQEGSQEARLELANVYEHGVGVPADGAKAVYWLQEASAKTIDLGPKLHLVQIYLDGKLVAKNPDAARAACATISQLRDQMLCMATVAERRDPPDYRKAAEWYKNGAEMGGVAAMLRYAELLAEGKGVKQDYAKAYYWLAVVSKVDRRHAEPLLDEVATKLTAKEIAKQDKAVERLKIVPPAQTSASAKKP